MESEEVVVAEVREEYDEEEYERPRRGLTAGPVIAVAIIAVLLGAVLIYVFIEPEVQEIVVLDPDYLVRGDENRYGIFVEIHVSGGMKSIEGTGTLEILFKGSTVYTQQVEVINEKGRAEVEFKDFVMENGNYSVVFSMGGKSDSANFVARMVPHKLDVSIQQGNPFTKETDGKMMVITPVFQYPNGEGESIFYYSSSYDITTRITDPNGGVEEITRTMWDWNFGNKTITKVWREIEGDIMGNYTLFAELKNNLVKDSSPYVTITGDPEEQKVFLNRAPILDEIEVPTRLRQNEEFTIRIDADDPDTNGRVVYYAVDWDLQKTEDDDIEFVELEEGGSTVVRLTHSYSELGDYTITVTCADNGPVGPLVPPDDLPEFDYQEFDTNTYTVVVRLI
ncbi:MAG: hypothetical protein ACMUIE_04150 [Thermoplasmatota archaeon]